MAPLGAVGVSSQVVSNGLLGIVSARARTSVMARASGGKPWQPMNARLVLEDGSVWHGTGFGAPGTQVAEVVFNTSLSGYQEIMTDPSYKGQFVTFTCPHIGNVGINDGALLLQKSKFAVCEIYHHFRRDFSFFPRR